MLHIDFNKILPVVKECQDMHPNQILLASTTLNRNVLVR